MNERTSRPNCLAPPRCGALGVQPISNNPTMQHSITPIEVMRVHIANKAFDLLNGVRIEEVVEEGLPRIWNLTWSANKPRIERMPNDYCEVGYHLVSALINGDVSGLDADDEFKLERFIEHYPDCVFTPDENEDGVIEEVIAKCDVTGLMNQCVTIKVFAR